MKKLIKTSIKQQFKTGNRIYSLGGGRYALGIKGKPAVKVVTRVNTDQFGNKTYAPARGRPPVITGTYAYHIPRVEASDALKDALGL